MRKLQFQDVFTGSRLLMSLGLKEELKKIGLEANSKKDIEAKGFDIFYMIIEKAITEKAEEGIYVFLSGLFECTPAEMRTMELTKLMGGLKEIASIEEWQGFFKRAASLMK